MSRRAGLLLTIGLLAFYGVVAYTSVLTKSPTFDEPTQAVAGWIRLRLGDHRINVANPPLTLDLAGLANNSAALAPDLHSPLWIDLKNNPAQEWKFSFNSLFRTPGVDGLAFVNRARALTLLIALLAGALIALWAARIAGPIAAVVAAALFAFDPTFLGHGPLVKNDVASALAMLGLGFVLWRIGQRLTRGWLAALAAVVGLSLNVKFSCTSFLPVAAVVLGWRALGSEPWPAFGRLLRTRRSRLGVAAGLLVAAALGAWAITWASYGFRFAGTPEGEMGASAEFKALRTSQIALKRGGRAGGAADLADWKPDAVARTVGWSLDHHVLPEAWLVGFLDIYEESMLRPAFLFGRTSLIGWWYYFPAAMLVKTPLATLLAGVLAAGLGIVLWRKRSRTFGDRWTAICVLAPPLLYFAASTRSRMNIGVRHELPVYAFAFVALGVVAAACIREWRRPALITVAVLLTGLGAETLRAAPDFIAFFNAAAGGERNGIHLLGDSNLDWGQDLPLLADWQRGHPEPHLYLAYFGTADPSQYGIVSQPLFGYRMFGAAPPIEPITPPAVLAVSATNLQGLPLWRDYGDRFSRLQRFKPMEILGGSIYLYDVPDAATAAKLTSGG